MTETVYLARDEKAVKYLSAFAEQPDKQPSGDWEGRLLGIIWLERFKDFSGESIPAGHCIPFRLTLERIG